MASWSSSVWGFRAGLVTVDADVDVLLLAYGPWRWGPNAGEGVAERVKLWWRNSVDAADEYE